MFYTAIKNYQTRYLSRTWQKALKQKEVERNNYHVTGDIKKAKAFVSMVNNFTFQTDFGTAGEHVIFSIQTLAVPICPAYAFALF